MFCLVSMSTRRDKQSTYTIFIHASSKEKKIMPKSKVPWARYKRSGHYARQLKSYRDKILDTAQNVSGEIDLHGSSTSQQEPSPEAYGIPAVRFATNRIEKSAIIDNMYSSSSSDAEDDLCPNNNTDVSDSNLALTDMPKPIMPSGG